MLTPHWAVYGSPHRGFDPGETRFRRNANKAASTAGAVAADADEQ